MTLNLLSVKHKGQFAKIGKFSLDTVWLFGIA